MSKKKRLKEPPRNFRFGFYHWTLIPEFWKLLSFIKCTPTIISCQPEKEHMGGLDSPDSYAKTVSPKGHRQGEQPLFIPFQHSHGPGCRRGTESCCLSFKLKANYKQVMIACLFLNPFTSSPVLGTYIILEFSGPHDKSTNTLKNSPGPHPRRIGYICIGV